MGAMEMPLEYKIS